MARKVKHHVKRRVGTKRHEVRRSTKRHEGKKGGYHLPNLLSF